VTDMQRAAWIAGKETLAAHWQILGLRAARLELDQQTIEAAAALAGISAELLAFAEGRWL